jgi:hypothetical protein
LRDAGAEIVVADSIDAALADLGRRGITSLFLEGGRTLASAFLAADAIDEARTFVAPVLLGGRASRDRVSEGEGGGAPPAQRRPLFRPDASRGQPPTPQAKNPASGRGAPTLPLHRNVETIGNDVLITARLKEW